MIMADELRAAGTRTWTSALLLSFAALLLSAGAAAAPPRATTTTPAPSGVDVGHTVLLGKRSRSSGCQDGPRPDRHCSPGATSSGLTKAVLCSTAFRTGPIRNVPGSVKSAVERDYGMVARPYGRSIEIDHIVSLELGGSNDIANLFPEPGGGPLGYQAKDRLENRLHALVCGGRMTLAAARRGIALNWVAQYRALF